MKKLLLVAAATAVLSSSAFAAESNAYYLKAGADLELPFLVSPQLKKSGNVSLNSPLCQRAVVAMRAGLWLVL